MYSRHFLIGLAFFFSCQSATETTVATDPGPQADELFNAYYEDRIRFYPLEATSAGDRHYNDTLTVYIGDDFLSRLGSMYEKYIRQIDNFDSTGLDAEKQLYLRIMNWEVRLKKDGLENPNAIVTSPMFGLPTIQDLPMNQIFSFHLYIGQLASGSSIQPFESAQDYENWLSRLDDYITWLETARFNMERGIKNGVVHPKIITERMISQLDPFIQAPLEEHVFYAPIRNMPNDLAPVERDIFAAKYAEFIDDRLRAAYRDLKDFLIEEYLPAGTETAGIGELPNGRTTYDYLIRYHTTTSMTAEEIHETGLREVERIAGEMQTIKNEIGFEGDLKEFFNYVRTNRDLMPFSEPQQVIDHFNEIHERMKPHLKELFDLTPESGFEVRRTEAFREASASAEYNAGSKDGSRPGVFYVPIPDVTTYNIYSDESLFLHEAIPGHHYQISLQQENDDIPEFLHSEGIGVYVEGWALYSESLGRELGLYKDQYQYFGMLGAEMHRAVRLVVDTGIHSKGWTREEAIQYCLDHEALSEAGIISEIERYMVAPGQALAYKIGQLKIRELRERAENELGENFDIREFHNQVLNTGSLPLILLEEKIDQWIASAKGPA